jgi:hypothetical protein
VDSSTRRTFKPSGVSSIAHRPCSPGSYHTTLPRPGGEQEVVPTVGEAGLLVLGVADPAHPIHGADADLAMDGPLVPVGVALRQQLLDLSVAGLAAQRDDGVPDQLLDRRACGGGGGTHGLGPSSSVGRSWRRSRSPVEGTAPRQDTIEPRSVVLTTGEKCCSWTLRASEAEGPGGKTGSEPMRPPADFVRRSLGLRGGLVRDPNPVDPHKKGRPAHLRSSPAGRHRVRSKIYRGDSASMTSARLRQILHYG